MSKTLTLSFLAAALAVSAACNKPSAPANTGSPGAQAPAAATDKPAAPAASTAAAPAPPPAPPPAPVPQQLPNVIARVNNEDIKKSDFEMLVRNVELSNGRPVPPERRDEILRGILNQLIEYTLLKQEALSRNIVITDAEVNQQLALMKQQAQSEAAFNKALADRRMTIDRLRADAKVELAIAKMMAAQEASAAAPTDEELKAYYDKNPDKFKREEGVRASHILIRVSEKAPEEDKKKARARIEAVLKRARAGEDFAVLAREHSQDESAAAGGDLGYVVKGTTPFQQAVYALKPNQVSDIVTTEAGYHIIKAGDRQPAGQVPLQEVTAQLKDFLHKQKQQEAGQAFINQIKQKAKIEVLI